jgi:hypothetical protein
VTMDRQRSRDCISLLGSMAWMRSRNGIIRVIVHLLHRTGHTVERSYKAERSHHYPCPGIYIQALLRPAAYGGGVQLLRRVVLPRSRLRPGPHSVGVKLFPQPFSKLQIESQSTVTFHKILVRGRSPTYAFKRVWASARHLHKQGGVYNNNCTSEQVRYSSSKDKPEAYKDVIVAGNNVHPIKVH